MFYEPKNPLAYQGSRLDQERTQIISMLEGPCACAWCGNRGIPTRYYGWQDSHGTKYSRLENRPFCCVDHFYAYYEE